MSTQDPDGIEEDIAQQLDAASGLGWFCDAIGNDMTGTGLVEIACRHVAATPGFPITEARFRKAGGGEDGSARRFFAMLAAVANSSPGWTDLRDAMARGVAVVANKIAMGEPYRGEVAAAAPTAPAQAAPPEPKVEPAPAPPAAPPPPARVEQAPVEDPAGPAAVEAEDKDLLPFVAILPPPPTESASELALVDWLGGRPWHPLALGMSFAEGTIDIDEMMEIEREVLCGVTTLLKREDIRGPQDPDAGAEHAKFLIAMSEHLGGAVELEGVEARIDAACRSVLERYWPTEARVMRAMGARITAGEEAQRACAAALDVERFLIGTGIEGQGRGAANPLGTPSPDCAIMPGHVLERAAALHMSGRAGIPLAEALCDALVEIRWAQAMREFGEENAVPLQVCEKLFHTDFEAPLTAFRQVREVEENPEP